MTIRSENRSGIVILHASGEFDISNVNALKDTFSVIVSQKRPHIVIDMAEVTFVDSSVLGAMVELFKNVREYGGSIRLSSMRPVIARTFALTRLDRVFELHDRLETAIAKEWR